MSYDFALFIPDYDVDGIAVGSPYLKISISWNATIWGMFRTHQLRGRWQILQKP